MDVEVREAGDCPTTTNPKLIPNRNGTSDDPRSKRILVANLSTNAEDAKLPQAHSHSNGEEGTYPRYPFQANYVKALPKQNNGRNSF